MSTPFNQEPSDDVQSSSITEAISLNGANERPRLVGLPESNFQYGPVHAKESKRKQDRIVIGGNPDVQASGCIHARGRPYTNQEVVDASEAFRVCKF